MKRPFVYRIDGMLMPELPAADAHDDESKSLLDSEAMS